MKNHFRIPKFHDFEIADEANDVVGTVRVKPSGILWAPKHSKVWYGLTLKQLGDHAEASGKKQKK